MVRIADVETEVTACSCRCHTAFPWVTGSVALAPRLELEMFSVNNCNRLKMQLGENTAITDSRDSL